jgi:hypothetical protein
MHGSAESATFGLLYWQNTSGGIAPDAGSFDQMHKTNADFK